MNEHMGRIQLILTKVGNYYPDLDDKDREAIRWLLDQVYSLKDQLAASRKETVLAMQKNIAMSDAAKAASAEFMRIAVS